MTEKKTKPKEKEPEETISEALHKIQQSLKVPKTHHNNFGNYDYRNAEDILNAVKPKLPNKYVILLNDELVYFGGNEGRFYIKATAQFWEVGTKNEVRTTAYAREPEIKKGMDSSQITGCASSYARKYALNGLLGICDVKDADDDSHGKAVETVKKVFPKAKVVSAPVLSKPTTEGKNSEDESHYINCKVNGTISIKQSRLFHVKAKETRWNEEDKKQLLAHFGYQHLWGVKWQSFQGLLDELKHGPPQQEDIPFEEPPVKDEPAKEYPHGF